MKYFYIHIIYPNTFLSNITGFPSDQYYPVGSHATSCKTVTISPGRETSQDFLSYHHPAASPYSNSLRLPKLKKKDPGSLFIGFFFS